MASPPLTRTRRHARVTDRPPPQKQQQAPTSRRPPHPPRPPPRPPSPPTSRGETHGTPMGVAPRTAGGGTSARATAPLPPSLAPTPHRALLPSPPDPPLRAPACCCFRGPVGRREWLPPLFRVWGLGFRV